MRYFLLVNCQLLLIFVQDFFEYGRRRTDGAPDGGLGEEI